MIKLKDYCADIVHEYKIEEINTSKYTTHKEGEMISKQQVMNLFKQVSTHASNDKFRVGITCDKERREKEHKAGFSAVIQCPNVDKANELEEMADDYGFDAGKHVGNAHCKKSKYVYIYQMTPDTVE